YGAVMRRTVRRPGGNADRGVTAQRVNGREPRPGQSGCRRGPTRVPVPRARARELTTRAVVLTWAPYPGLLCRSSRVGAALQRHRPAWCVVTGPAGTPVPLPEGGRHALSYPSAARGGRGGGGVPYR